MQTFKKDLPHSRLRKKDGIINLIGPTKTNLPTATTKVNWTQGLWNYLPSDPMMKMSKKEKEKGRVIVRY